MSDRLSKRWIIVGLLWAAILGMNHWNVAVMQEIQGKRRQKIFLSMDEQFLKAHARQISESLEKREAFFHSAEALELGLLTVENELRGLASRHGLTGIQVTCLAREGEDGQVPVELSCRGSLKNLVQCLQALREQYAYVPVTKVTVGLDGPGATARCRVRLNYRYRITGTGERT